MKKFLAIMLSLMLLTGLFPCAGVAESKPLTVVTTIFPIYDWARQIIGENGNTNLVLLLDNGVDLHSYQPSAQDIMTISTADLFIYVGGESDEWVEDVLESAMNPDLVAISLTEAMVEDLKEEEIVEGMQHDHDHEHEHEDEYDEHVWLSLRNARKLTVAIAEALAGIDAANADAIRENAAAYDAQLQELDAKYTETVENAALKTVVFGDRFPFRYMTDDYGLTYYAAFTGCSAESEASFETIAFLAGKADELNLPAVLTIEGGNHKIADTVISASAKAGRKVLTMNSMQSVTADDVKNGMTYLSIMEENLTVLKEALN